MTSFEEGRKRRTAERKYYVDGVMQNKVGSINARSLNQLIESKREMWDVYLERVILGGPIDTDDMNLLSQIGSEIKGLIQIQNIYFHFQDETKGEIA